VLNEPKLVERLRGLEAHLQGRIRGQDHLLPKLAAVFCRGALQLTSPERPGGALLLVGPTGTGKSESFICACDYVFESDHMVTIDLSEYQDAGSVARLLGNDRSDPGLLAKSLSKVKSGGLLFDEIEKAHPMVLDLFLQMLWRGYYMDATGEVHRLNEYVIGFTSNLGASETMRMASSSSVSATKAILRRVAENLRPEFLGRLDEQLVFNRLGPEVQREICELEVTRELNRLRKLGYEIEATPEAVEFLVREGFDREVGARPLRKTVERRLQDAVADALMRSGISIGMLVPDADCSRLIVRRTRLT
jgi:ATP-dependent Clp protease ATP-binding subunit ClpA